jgi:hypothetical protein
MMNTPERFQRLKLFIDEGRIIRKNWGNGQDQACLLLALAPEVGEHGQIELCPVTALPYWLATLTPALDDTGSDDAWPAMIRRYSNVVSLGMKTLDKHGWRRVMAKYLIAVLAEAIPHDKTGNCAKVSALWERTLIADDLQMTDWEKAIRQSSDYQTDNLPTRVADAAARAALKSYYVTSATNYAAKIFSKNSKAGNDAFAEAWDRMTNVLFDVIESECNTLKEIQP